MLRAALVIRSAAFVVLGAAVPALPQGADPRVAGIRALYTTVQARVAQAVRGAATGGASGFYSTDVIVNSHNGSWRAVGTYSRKTRYWYTDQPEFARREDKTEESVLVTVEVDETAAIHATHRAFLFDRGRLVFAFIRAADGPSNRAERRYYFDNGVAFRYLEGSSEAAIPGDAAAVAREGSALQASFLATFNAP